MGQNSSGVYICKLIVNYLRHGNYICKSKGNGVWVKEQMWGEPAGCVFSFGEPTGCCVFLSVKFFATSRSFEFTFVSCF